MQILTNHERQSTVWKKITEHLEARLASLRVKNDASRPAEETEKLRGRILEVKHLLGLDAESPETESDDVQDY